MMKQYKEIELPITWENVWKILLVVAWISIFTLPFLVRNPIYDIKFMPLYVLGICATMTMSIMLPMTYGWDMNLFHKFGYCVRMKSIDDKQKVGSVE